MKAHYLAILLSSSLAWGLAGCERHDATPPPTTATSPAETTGERVGRAVGEAIDEGAEAAREATRAVGRGLQEAGKAVDESAEHIDNRPDPEPPN